MQRETKFKNQAKRELDKLPLSFFIKTQMVALRGVPDFIGCVRGRLVAIELKTETGRVDRLQQWTLQKFADAGAFTAVVRPSTLNETIEQLRRI